MNDSYPTTVEEALKYFVANHPDAFTEAYVVTDTVEVVAKGRIIRIETIRYVHGEGQRHDVRVYEKKDSQWEIWDNFPYCDRDTPTAVMMQALSFLYEAVKSE